MNPLHRELECQSDISKADLKIAYPNSYHDFQLRIVFEIKERQTLSDFGFRVVSPENVRISVNMLIMMLVDSNSWY